MAYWIVDDHGFGGMYYRCSECGACHWDILDDDFDREQCSNCNTAMDEEATVYMKNGRVEK